MSACPLRMEGYSIESLMTAADSGFRLLLVIRAKGVYSGSSSGFYFWKNSCSAEGGTAR